MDPDGLDTWLVLYGHHALNTDLEGERGDVGRNFEIAAETRAAEIRDSPEFDPQTDAVIVEYTPLKSDFINAINQDYATGPIQGLDIYRHAYEYGLNLGGSSGSEYNLRLVQSTDLSSLNPKLAKNALTTLRGCNTAASSTKMGIGQAFARRFPSAIVRGYKGPVRFLQHPNRIKPTKVWDEAEYSDRPLVEITIKEQIEKQMSHQ